MQSSGNHIAALQLLKTTESHFIAQMDTISSFSPSFTNISPFTANFSPKQSKKALF